MYSYFAFGNVSLISRYFVVEALKKKKRINNPFHRSMDIKPKPIRL